MKKIYFFLCALFLMGAASVGQASAKRITILYGNGPEFQKMYNLPDSLTSEEGNPLEFGITFEQFSLFYVPIWNYGEKEWAVYDAKARTIYTLDEETLAEFGDDYGWDVAKMPALSFWNAIGGKLVLLLVLGAIGGFLLWKKAQEENAKAEDND
ncbi:MAG: hypothetical protein K2G93_00290 [Rikenella sp.]|nr:hypothetical protein [Rikenella sp.]